MEGWVDLGAPITPRPEIEPTILGRKSNALNTVPPRHLDTKDVYTYK